MATDSATLDRRVTASRRASDSPKIQSPADPIARGMGLDGNEFTLTATPGSGECVDTVMVTSDGLQT